MSTARYSFAPELYEAVLETLLGELAAAEPLSPRSFDRIVRRYPRDGRALFSKAQLIRGLRHLRQSGRPLPFDAAPLELRLCKKPVRTLSGVAPVTVLTQPWPCPGRCVFCPNDVRMPKSYLADEPGAQRAAQNHFDPYAQTFNRLRALRANGHRVDKVELLVLGGTWSAYPEGYQRWFVHRCFDALNDFVPSVEQPAAEAPPAPHFADPRWQTGGAATYNRRLERVWKEHTAGSPGAVTTTSWDDLAAVQRRNEGAVTRCVGLVLETRPDCVDEAEVLRLRRLGATKIQLGLQSLDDELLRRNRRGHDVATARRAIGLLRSAGFKLVAHWMPNLVGADPSRDRADFCRLFDDPTIRPDELKIYPCLLVESADLVREHAAGRWQPYAEPELVELLLHCLERTPSWCRLTRVIRDIPGGDIAAGSRTTNLRQVAELELAARGGQSRDIRAREIRDGRFVPGQLELRQLSYTTGVGEERFLELVTGEERLAGFLRLSLPRHPSFVEELGGAAIIREVHVYGRATGLGRSGGVQHRGLGMRLLAAAERAATQAGYQRLAVISAVGTRRYYRRRGFEDGVLYQHRRIAGS